jgi:type IV pilus assembly protein PilO
MTKKLKQNLAAVIGMFAALVFVYFNYMLGPLEAKHKESLKKLDDMQAKLVEMKKRALELPLLQAEMVILEQEVSDLEKSLPKDKEIPDLLRIVTKTAQDFQLNITNFSPGNVVPKENYNEVQFNITLTGSYHALALFLAEMGQKPRIFSARNINFIAVPRTKEGGNTVSVTFMFIAYTFKG